MWPWKKNVEAPPSAEEIAQQMQKWWDETVEYVRRCADAADPGNISIVRTSERQAIVTAELLRRAKRQVLIHVDVLSPEIFGTMFMLDAVETFLNNSRPDGTISIITYEPISAAKGSILKRLLAHPRIFASVEDEQVRKIAKFQFAVADGTSYWFKNDEHDLGMFVFGDEVLGKSLERIFSKVDIAAYHAA